MNELFIERMKELLKEKVEMYNFNPKVIEKIINEE